MEGMMFFYSDASEQVSRGPRKGYEHWDACKAWAMHTYNRICLQHISATTRDFREKAQAEREIQICDRKRAWWEKHPNFSSAGASGAFERDFRMALPAELRRE
jgi:hypothetical protein